MKKLISITLSALLMMTFMCSCGNNKNEKNIGDDGKLQNEENINDNNNVNDKANGTADNDGLLDEAGDAVDNAADKIENGMDNAASSVDDALTDDKANNNDTNK